VKRHWQTLYRELRADQAISFEVRRALQTGLDRDPVDAARDAELVARVLRARCSEVLGTGDGRTDPAVGSVVYLDGPRCSSCGRSEAYGGSTLCGTCVREMNDGAAMEAAAGMLDRCAAWAVGPDLEELRQVTAELRRLLGDGCEVYTPTAGPGPKAEVADACDNCGTPTLASELVGAPIAGDPNGETVMACRRCRGVAS